jgi:Dolichyl-phosphate-mannose-protein mannosyltransferase
VTGASLAEPTRRVAAPLGDRAVARTISGVLRVALIGVAVFALAALIRLWSIDTYVTIDESRWVQRASDFWALIGQGNREDTFIIGHPGVTTMWTALLGMGPERARHFSFLEGRDDATRRDGYFDALIAARRPFALVGALGVMAVTLLGWRLLGMGPALLAGLLLAFEPFLVAHARVVHLDSALTTYSSIALLAGLVFWSAGGGWPYLVLSGIAAGLAFLTKAPSVFVIGFVPLMAFVTWAMRLGRSPRTFAALVGQGLIWGGLAFAVAILLWPAFRVDPIGTVLKMAQFTERVGGGEHDNYFFGEVTDDPGPLFYPLALLLRLAPLTLVGLIGLAILGRRLDAPRRRTAIWLALYSAGFIAMMDIGPKKFDRYLLPIFPSVGLLAGLGFWLIVRRDARMRRRWAAPYLPAGAAILVLQAATLLSVQAYPLAYYNPLLGGGALAERLVLVGWGEGLDQVASWLNSQPRAIGAPTIATSYHRVLQAQLDGSAVPLERVRMADYVVPYVNTLQRGEDDDVLAPYLANGQPEFAVRVNGIEYARVYRGPHFPLGDSVGAEFGGRTALLSYVAAPGSGDLRPTEDATVQLRWDRPAAADERVVVAIAGPDGRVVAQNERPVGSDGPDEQGRPGEIHTLTVPRGTPAGEYRLTVRVVDPRARVSLPVTSGPAAGQDTIVLRTLTIGRAP